jgi:hypothetical protein
MSPKSATPVGGVYHSLRCDLTYKLPAFVKRVVESARNDMPKQAPLRIIKRCRLYLPRGQWNKIPHVTRGIYVLYKKKPLGGNQKTYEVFYIGAAGVSKNGKSGIRGRIKNHHKTKKTGWTHYSFFEVHDNVSREEILELESLFLRIFRHDPRVKLDNVQLGSTTLRNLSKDSAPAWSSD